MRYTPFFANSGFYYLPNHPTTEFFAYRVMAAFDVLCASGSHQNVFTTKLMELMDLAGITSRMLPLEEFPTGIMYHHEKKYMEAIQFRNGTVNPYHFHMCWTSHKRDKIKYFKETNMWYLQDKCYIQNLWPPSVKDKKSMFNSIMKGYRELEKKQRNQHYDKKEVKSALDLCCRTKYKTFAAPAKST